MSKPKNSDDPSINKYNNADYPFILHHYAKPPNFDEHYGSIEKTDEYVRDKETVEYLFNSLLPNTYFEKYLKELRDCVITYKVGRDSASPSIGDCREGAVNNYLKHYLLNKEGNTIGSNFTPSMVSKVSKQDLYFRDLPISIKNISLAYVTETYNAENAPYVGAPTDAIKYCWNQSVEKYEPNDDILLIYHRGYQSGKDLASLDINKFQFWMIYISRRALSAVHAEYEALKKKERLKVVKPPKTIRVATQQTIDFHAKNNQTLDLKKLKKGEYTEEPEEVKLKWFDAELPVKNAAKGSKGCTYYSQYFNVLYKHRLFEIYYNIDMSNVLSDVEVYNAKIEDLEEKLDVSNIKLEDCNSKLKACKRTVNTIFNDLCEVIKLTENLDANTILIATVRSLLNFKNGIHLS